jgi:hypothetical protein
MRPSHPAERRASHLGKAATPVGSTLPALVQLSHQSSRRSPVKRASPTRSPGNRPAAAARTLILGRLQASGRRAAAPLGGSVRAAGYSNAMGARSTLHPSAVVWSLLTLIRLLAGESDTSRAYVRSFAGAGGLTPDLATPGRFA